MGQFVFTFQETWVSMTIEETGGNKATARLSTTEIEGLIAKLADLRKDMEPQIPRQLPDGPITGEADPIWAMPTHPAAADKLLAIRHHKLGWLTFLFPEKECRKLGQGLLHGLPPEIPGQPPIRH